MERKPATVLREVSDRTVRFVLSDGIVDRMGDTVAVSGWSLEAYRKNPVVLFSHDSSSPPIGRMRSVWSDGTRLLGDVEFADKETYGFADTIFRLVKGGFLKSGSVGFLPTDYEFSKRPSGGIDYKQTELLEFSIVPVPANSNALVEARMKGLISIRDARRLRRALDDSPLPSAVIGNCGRPADQECGLKNKDECATHGEIAVDGDEQDKRLHRLIVRSKRAALNAPTPQPADESRASQEDYVRRLRERHGFTKPRAALVAADVAHRMRRW